MSRIMLIDVQKALNLFNAALVTPTYYVYFTSATIISSAVLFRGFHGSVISIITIVMGFLQICAGVVLLQLAKSSKDVPDTAVFKGDLDQVRTIAEQEEPESEPRADTIRGGAALIRALSKRRTARQHEEVKSIYTDTMEPISENEVVEWDGLRRRKTVLGSGSQSGTIRRTKTVHPPLGMSQFPDETSEADSEDVHPGFFPRFGRSSTRRTNQTSSTRRTSPSPVAMTGLHTVPNKSASSASADSHEHIYGLPAGLRKDGAVDTAYHSPLRNTTGGTIRWDPSAIEHDERSRASSHGSSLAPPKPPPHGHGSTAATNNAKRTFSFQNVFHRHKSDAADTDTTSRSSRTDDGRPRPPSRSGLSYSSVHSGGRGTEEERLGLVTGDSNVPRLPAYSEEPEDIDDYGDLSGGSDEWQHLGGRSESDEHPLHADLDATRTNNAGRGNTAYMRNRDDGPGADWSADERGSDDLSRPPRRQTSLG